MAPTTTAVSTAGMAMAGVGASEGGAGTTGRQGKDRAAEVLNRNEAYLAELLSFSLDRRNKEPELLRDEQERIQRQLEETAFKNYRAFVATAECIEKVAEGLGKIGTDLSSVYARVPEIEGRGKVYECTLEGHLRDQKQTKAVSASAAQVQEILEVTQLMETCVRQGSYDEALDLEAFVSKLVVLHPNVEVVASLAARAKDLSRQMQSKLFSRLRQGLQLPECLRIVGYLRRMGTHTESGLREEYLECRDGWFQELVDGLPRHDHYGFVKRLTDYHRVHLFDVIMQFRAIFSTKDAPAAAGAAKNDEKFKYADLLHVWAARRVASYLQLLRGSLHHIKEGANLSSVFEHCMYCGMSLGRIGLDFRCLLVPVFEDAVRNLFGESLKRAVVTFGIMLAGYKWPRQAPDAQQQQQQQAPGGPPYELMQHPPLAVLANGILLSFNELRHCAPKAMAAELQGALSASLGEVDLTLKWYGVASDLDDSERQSFKGLCSQYKEVMVPYVRESFGKIYDGVR